MCNCKSGCGSGRGFNLGCVTVAGFLALVVCNCGSGCGVTATALMTMHVVAGLAVAVPIYICL